MPSISELQTLTLHSLLPKLPPGWIEQLHSKEYDYVKSKAVTYQAQKREFQNEWTHCVTDTANMSWTVHVHNSPAHFFSPLTPLVGSRENAFKYPYRFTGKSVSAIRMRTLSTWPSSERGLFPSIGCLRR